MLKKLQEKAGFVSLETIIVTGCNLGLYGLTQYQDVGKLAIELLLMKLLKY